MLITDDNHFASMLKEMTKDIPNNLQLKKNHYLDYF